MYKEFLWVSKKKTTLKKKIEKKKKKCCEQNLPKKETNKKTKVQIGLCINQLLYIWCFNICPTCLCQIRLVLIICPSHLASLIVLLPYIDRSLPPWRKTTCQMDTNQSRVHTLTNRFYWARVLRSLYNCPNHPSARCQTTQAIAYAPESAEIIHTSQS